MYKILSYLYFLIILAGLEITIFKPDFFWYFLPAALVINIFAIWLTTKKKWDLNFANYLISPFLFLLSGIIFGAFADGMLIEQVVAVFIATTGAVFLQRLTVLIHYKYQYKEHSLSNISRILNMSTIFFWFSNSFDLYAFLKISNWILMPVGVIIVFLVTYQFFCISKIKKPSRNIFILAISLVLFELFYVIGWLPIISISKGLLLVSAYYFVTSLAKHEMEDTLAKTVYLRYSLVTVIIWIMVLTTARWE